MMPTEVLQPVETNTDFEVRSLDFCSVEQVKPDKPISYLKYILMGILFGVILVKSEVISWYRIQEMFRLQSFQMFGVMGSALVTGIISVWIIKKFKIKSISGETIHLPTKKFHKGQVYGGLIFGFGWAITGACPGPLFAQVGSGFTVVLMTILSALAGTWVYGYFKEKLPH